LSVRAYLSNLSPRWPFERQEADHAAHTPGWPDVPTFRDTLSVRKRIAHQPASLKERASLLRPSGREPGEVIYVASLAVLAIGAADFMDVCAAASGRRAAILEHETGTLIPFNAGADALSDALNAFLDSKRRSEHAGEKWKPGAAASAQKRMEDAKRRAELIREDWCQRGVPTAELLLRAGRKIGRRRDVVPMSYQTAALLLGKRPAAQRKAETDVFRERRRLEALARRKAESGEDK
jgi:hypothetical protein